jgi:hypothetical protein
MKSFLCQVRAKFLVAYTIEISFNCRRSVPCLKMLFAAHVRSVAEKLAIGQILLRVLGVSSASFHQHSYTYPSNLKMKLRLERTAITYRDT